MYVNCAYLREQHKVTVNLGVPIFITADTQQTFFYCNAITYSVALYQISKFIPKKTCKARLFLSIAKRWHIIAEGVYHQPKATLVFAMMIHNAFVFLWGLFTSLI